MIDPTTLATTATGILLWCLALALLLACADTPPHEWPFLLCVCAPCALAAMWPLVGMCGALERML